MTRIYKVKNVPASIKTRFETHYGKGVMFDFYWYRGARGKCYGAFTSKNGQPHGYAYQIYV